MPSFILKSFALFLSCLCMTGCLQIKDDNGWWDKGVIDEELLGKWVKPKDDMSMDYGFEVSPSDQNFLYFRGARSVTVLKDNHADDIQFKTIRLGNINFAIGKNYGSIFMIPYKITGDKLEGYVANLKNKGVVQKLFPGQQPPENPQMVVVKMLDDQTIKDLMNIFSNPNDYEVYDTYHKVDAWPDYIVQSQKDMERREAERQQRDQEKLKQ